MTSKQNPAAEVSVVIFVPESSAQARTQAVHPLLVAGLGPARQVPAGPPGSQRVLLFCTLPVSGVFTVVGCAGCDTKGRCESGSVASVL